MKKILLTALALAGLIMFSACSSAPNDPADNIHENTQLTTRSADEQPFILNAGYSMGTLRLEWSFRTSWEYHGYAVYRGADLLGRIWDIHTRHYDVYYGPGIATPPQHTYTVKVFRAWYDPIISDNVYEIIESGSVKYPSTNSGGGNDNNTPPGEDPMPDPGPEVPVEP